jgi:hypothetical protein
LGEDGVEEEVARLGEVRVDEFASLGKVGGYGLVAWCGRP